MDTTQARRPAVLLLGPTGSGKTPLGQQLEVHGLWGQRCVHFDFGANLRAAVQRDLPDAFFSREDLDFLRQVLRSGALLEDEHFPLAERILRAFLARQAADQHTWVVLNGLPRHIGQAQAIAPLLDVRLLVHLDCPAEVVLRRLHSNVGGDRASRPDDQLELVTRKLALYRQRTAPLMEYYRDRGAEIVELPVAADSTPAQMWAALQGSTKVSKAVSAPNCFLARGVTGGPRS